MSLRLLFPFQIFVLFCSIATASPLTDQQQILRGVNSIQVGGSVGSLLVYGETAIPLAEGQKNGVNYPVAAAARLENGRLVAFGHESAFGDQFEANEKLLTNLFSWLSGTDSDLSSLKIAVDGDRKMMNALSQRNIPFTELNAQNWKKLLSESNVIVANVGAMTNEQADELATYVKAGGGLLCGFPGWAWSSYIAKEKGAILKDECPANRLYQQAGIVWTTSIVSLTDQRAKVSNKNSLLGTNVLMLLDAIEDPKTADQIAPETVASALLQIGGSIPSNDTTLIPRLKKLLQKSQSRLVAPTSQKTISKANTQAYLGCLLDAVYAAAAPPEELMASELGIPSLGICRKASKREAISANISTKRHGRYGFGAYAYPGELVSITLPPTAVDAGFKIRVGAHSDKLWDKDKWERPPQVDRVYPVDSNSFNVANAYGGLIYLEVPRNCKLESVQIKVENVIAAPYYKHGVTDPADWRSSLRNAPGPWAELETDKIVLTLPTEMIRQLDFPDKLMDHWNEVLDACADLAGISRDRPRHERIVADVQPSAGYLHSGYPIVADMQASPQMGSYPEMVSQGDWGYYHELGHNHQQKEWTFDGTVEVTCNLFGLYCFDVLHKGKANHRFSDMTKWYQEARQHIANGAPYEVWKSKPFLALTMYEQMVREFGWEPFKTIFAEYQKMPAAQKPKTDLERRDQWMVRFSRHVNRNLGPFFEAWGVPTTEEARKSIADLPVWMPESLSSDVSR